MEHLLIRYPKPSSPPPLLQKASPEPNNTTRPLSTSSIDTETELDIHHPTPRPKPPFRIPYPAPIPDQNGQVPTDDDYTRLFARIVSLHSQGDTATIKEQYELWLEFCHKGRIVHLCHTLLNQFQRHRPLFREMRQTPRQLMLEQVTTTFPCQKHCRCKRRLNSTET